MTLKMETVQNVKERDSTGIEERQPDELHRFIEQVGRSLRGVKFKAINSELSWVYRESDFLAMGMIGYGDFQTSRYGDKSYAVFAPSIINGKYSDYSKQGHMRMSKNMKTTLRHAKANLIKVPTLKAAAPYIAAVGSRLSRKSGKLDDERRTAVRALGLDYNWSRSGTNAALHELLALHKRDHEWSDPTFGPKVQHYIDCEHAAQLYDSKPTPAMFVHMYEKFGGQYCDIVDVSNTREFTEYRADQYGTVRDMVAYDQLGTDIQNRLATLHMLDADDYVEEVGIKINNAAYLLHV